MLRHVTARPEPSLFADRTLLKIALRFLVCVAALLGLIVWAGAHTHIVTDIMVATAATSTALINFSGIVATRVGTTINVPGRGLIVGPECTGLTIAAVLASLIVVYPVRVSSKAIGIMAGVMVVFCANLARLVLVAHISRAPATVFVIAHDFLFQVGMVAVAVGVWIAWLSFARARES